MRDEDRERAVVEVISRVAESIREDAGRGGPSFEEVAADTLWHERQRLDAARRSRAVEAERLWHREAGRRLLHGAPGDHVQLVTEMIERFAREIVGRFDPRVHAVTTKVLPVAAGVMVNAVSPLSLLSRFPDLPRLDDNIVVRGAAETLRRVSGIGTVILTPTHLSHMDSIVLGYAMYLLGLPPFTYGAGLNLFTNPLLSFFMHNLGAYKVDRRKKAPLYKTVLKEYAALSMEYGYDNLFFPGGTRSRSGAVERRLKLGLLGSGLRAYVRNLQRGVPKPRVFIVPCTLSYGLVLEARTLIEDHLQEAGRARYIIEDDEFSKPRVIFRFVRDLISLDAKIVLNVSEPLDPFGNRVLPDGVSVDPRGRPIDIERYTLVGDRPGFDRQRDEEYTREMGRAVIRSLCRDATFMPTHLLAFAMFGLLRVRAPDRDLFRFLRTADEIGGVPMDEVYAALERLRAAVARRTDRGELGAEPVPFGFDPESVVRDGLRYFGTYHARPVVERRGDRLFPGDATLLYYYRNRLSGFGMERAVDDRLDGVTA